MSNHKNHVLKKVSELLRFLKKSDVFNDFTELNKREEAFVYSHHSFSDNGYNRSQIVPDYLLLLNKKNKSNSKNGRSIGISVVYLGLNEEDSYFIASVSDYTSPLQSAYRRDYKKSSNVHYSARMSYQLFSERLRSFNKIVRNSSDHSQVIDTFAKVMDIFNPKNEEEKNEVKIKLTEQNKKLEQELSQHERSLASLEKEYKQQRTQIRKALGTIYLEKQVEQILSQLKNLRQEIADKEKKRHEMLEPLKIQMNVEHKNIKQIKGALDKTTRDAKLISGDASFLKD